MEPIISGINPISSSYNLNDNTDDIFTGLTNTNNIVEQCSDASIAARLCYDSNSGGYDDWYLPSWGELALLLSNVDLISYNCELQGGDALFTTSNTYWCSSQQNEYGAYCMTMNEDNFVGGCAA